MTDVNTEDLIAALAITDEDVDTYDLDRCRRVLKAALALVRRENERADSHLAAFVRARHPLPDAPPSEPAPGDEVRAAVEVLVNRHNIRDLMKRAVSADAEAGRLGYATIEAVAIENGASPVLVLEALLGDKSAETLRILDEQLDSEPAPGDDESEPVAVYLGDDIDKMRCRAGVRDRGRIPAKQCSRAAEVRAFGMGWCPEHERRLPRPTAPQPTSDKAKLSDAAGEVPLPLTRCPMCGGAGLVARGDKAERTTIKCIGCAGTGRIKRVGVVDEESES